MIMMMVTNMKILLMKIKNNLKYLIILHLKDVIKKYIKHLLKINQNLFYLQLTIY